MSFAHYKFDGDERTIASVKPATAWTRDARVRVDTMKRGDKFLAINHFARHVRKEEPR
jgi:hypothetical protein